MAADAADIFTCCAYCAGAVAVFDCAAIVIAADAADIACSADCAGAVAVFDCAVFVVPAADAADITTCSADCAGAEAVFDCAVVIAADAADRVAAAYTAV